MRRDPSIDVARAARRRLEDLTRLRDPDADPDADPELAVAIPEFPAAVVAAPGRHARPGPGVLAARLVAWRERVPLPESLRPAHVGLVALAATIALLVTLWGLLRTRPEPVPVASSLHSATGAPAPAGASALTGVSTAPGAAASSPAGATATAGATVVVDVAGRVRRPGVTTLPAGSRVIDALRKAGGARGGVDLTGLNLARVLVDGEQILVGLPAVAGVASGSAAAPGGPAPLVNLNTATEELLESLPGVGPVTAAKIVEWRTTHGAFTAIDDLLEVDGIGPKTLARIAPGVTL